MDVPGVGRAFASSSGHVRVDFDDGTRLDVEPRRANGQNHNQHHREGDNSMEYVDAAGRTTRFHPGEDFLPREVKEKLKRLPSVLDKLASLKL